MNITKYTFKHMNLKKLLSFLLLLIVLLTGCTQLSWVTFYGKKPVQITENNKLITIYWNYPSKEENVKKKLDAKIEEIKLKEHFISDSIIFQSNNDIYHGIRTYIIRFFKNENERTDFINKSNMAFSDVNNELNSVDFNSRLHSLKHKSKIKTVFKTIPELLEYKSVQSFYEDSTVLKIAHYELSFNSWGRLDTLLINK